MSMLWVMTYFTNIDRATWSCLLPVAAHARTGADKADAWHGHAAGDQGSVDDVFCQTFTAGMPGLGETLIVPLCEGGADIAVTEDNRRQYVEAYMNFALDTSVHKQVDLQAQQTNATVHGCVAPSIHLYEV